MLEGKVVMLTPHGDPLGRIGEPDIGGQCVYVRELAARLASDGIGVVALTRDRGQGRPREEPIAPGAKVVRIPCGPQGFVPKEELFPYLDEFAERSRPYLKGAGVIHSHYWDGGYVAERIRDGRLWIHTSHSLGKLKRASLPDEGRYRYAGRIEIETEVYTECDRVIALTRRERDDLVSLYGVPREKIVVIPPGVDVRRFRPSGDKGRSRGKVGFPLDRPVVFSLGRLDERKGFDLLFRAAAEVIQGSPGLRPLFVLSAGTGHPNERRERERLEGLLEELGIGEWVRWLGVIPEHELPAYYEAADLFVLPSRYEPFGIALLEAMACGVPVVATVHGGPSEIIEPGEEGILVDPTDTRSLARAIVELLGDPGRREEMGRKARERVVAEFSWEMVARKVRKLYSEDA